MNPFKVISNLVTLVLCVVAFCLGGFSSRYVDVFRPAMPVTVSFRKSALGEGHVAVIKNESERDIAVWLRHQKAEGEAKEGIVILDAGDSDEYGWIEGWKFQPGDRLLVQESGHKSIKVTVE